MKQDIRLFACGYDRYENKFGYFAYANRLDKETQNEIKGKRITVKTSSYPFYFNGKCVPIEFPINIGIETTTGAIAKKIMSRLSDYYIVNNGKMQNDENIDCLHTFEDLSIERFTIDTEKGIIDNVFIGS